MDDTNKEILRLLRDNGRMSFTEIGEILGISRVAVKKRVEKLEEAGIIRGYKAVIYREGSVKMFLDITTVDQHYESLLSYLNRTGYVTELYVMTETDHIHATAVAPDVSELKYLTKMLKKKFPDIIKCVETHLVKEIVKDTFGGVTMVDLNEEVAKEMNKYLDDICIQEVLLRRKELFHYKVILGKIEMDSDIDVLDLSPRSSHCLRRAGVNTIRDLLDNFESKPNETTRKQLKKLNNLGDKSAEEIIMKLFYYNFSVMPESKRKAYMEQLVRENP